MTELTILLGNSVPFDGNQISATIRDTITTFHFVYQPGDDEIELLQDNPKYSSRINLLTDEQKPYFKYLLEVEHAWPFHSGIAPAWVECEDEILQDLIARQFRTQVGRPEGWEVKFDATN